MVSGVSAKGALFFKYLRDLASSRYEPPYSPQADSPDVAFSRLRTSSDPGRVGVIAIDERLIMCRASG